MHATHQTTDTDATTIDTDNLDLNSFSNLPASALVPSDETTDSGAGIILDHRTFDLSVHDGMVTIHNPATGNHRTFRIRTQRDGAKFAPGKRIVSLLTGPNREDPESWQSFGFIETDLSGSARVYVWAKYRNDTGGAWNTFARMLTAAKAWAETCGVEFLVEARCRRCGRPLSRPDSIASGLGSICAGRE